VVRQGAQGAVGERPGGDQQTEMKPGDHEPTFNGARWRLEISEGKQ
jgi:hypothetical protein